MSKHKKELEIHTKDGVFGFRFDLWAYSELCESMDMTIDEIATAFTGKGQFKTIFALVRAASESYYSNKGESSPIKTDRQAASFLDENEGAMKKIMDAFSNSQSTGDEAASDESVKKK